MGKRGKRWNVKGREKRVQRKVIKEVGYEGEEKREEKGG